MAKENDKPKHKMVSFELSEQTLLEIDILRKNQRCFQSRSSIMRELIKEGLTII
jgi:hypothetical protein